MRNLTGSSMRLLRRSLPALGEREREAAERVLAAEGDILRRFSALIDAAPHGPAHPLPRRLPPRARCCSPAATS